MFDNFNKILIKEIQKNLENFYFSEQRYAIAFFELDTLDPNYICKNFNYFYCIENLLATTEYEVNYVIIDSITLPGFATVRVCTKLWRRKYLVSRHESISYSQLDFDDPKVMSSILALEELKKYY